MARFFASIFLTTSFSFIAGFYLPWWSIAVVAFVIAFVVRQSIGRGFLSGFLGIFLLWGLLATWIDIKNASVLSHKIALLFPLGGSHVLLILVTAFIGALVGGFAGMSGSSLFYKRKPYIQK